MSFSNIQRKFVSFQPGVLLLKVIVNSLIQLSQIMKLVAQTGIISIYGHSAILDSQRKIVDIDQEE